MISIKTEKEIESMKKGGQILGSVLFSVLKVVKPGVTELEIDQEAEKLIRQKGGESGFKKVEGYKHTICVATNDVVVHGIPTKQKFVDGDVVCIDCGVYYEGFHTDMAETIIVGKNDDPGKVRFLEAGKKALNAGIEQAVVGNRVGHISNAIAEIIENEYGFSIVRSLVGHGVGKELHEEPEVPGYVVGSITKSPLLKVGMTIAIEVIYAMGSSEVVYANDDGWTITTADGSLSAVFERTVAITNKGPLVLT